MGRPRGGLKSLPLRISLTLSIIAFVAGAEPSTNYKVLWEHDFGSFPSLFFLQGAVVDEKDNLWVLTSAFARNMDYTREQRLFRIDGSGAQRSAVEIEAHIGTDVETDLAEYYPAILPTGPIGFLVNLLRVVGRDSRSLGAFYAPLSNSGAIGNPIRISETDGPISWQMLALNDGDLLAVGNQSPLLVQKISREGKTRWQRRFSKSLALPSAAALPGGESCVVASDFTRNSDAQELNLLHLDAGGVLRGQTKFHGHLAVVTVGPKRSCGVFYYDFLPRRIGTARYHLTAFDASLSRQWTTDIPPSLAGPTGMDWHLITLRDGYLASGIAWTGNLFLAKYSFTGQLSWVETRKLSSSLNFFVPNSDGFYLIGEIEKQQGPPTSFRVTRVTVF